MDFSVIFQLRTKKFWWMDVIFYFVISLLIATVLCWLIFLVKNMMIRKDIQKEIVQLQGVGTNDQKQQEEDVINYRKKINDFTNLFGNHQFASNVFAFMQSETVPNVWFKQFNLDEKAGTVQLSGETDDVDSFSRQVAILENNKYVKSIGTLNSSSAQSAKINFNINLDLNHPIFDYIAQTASAKQVISAEQSLAQQASQTNAQQDNQGNITPPANGQQTVLPTTQTPTKSSEKFITFFHLPLNPEIAGVLDQTNFTVTLNVPYGTDVKNLSPSIIISPNAVVLPATDVSQDFTSPVTYMVTAEDGTIQNYQVQVIVTTPPVVKKQSNYTGIITLIVILFIVIIAVAIAGIFLYRKNKFKNKR